MQLIFSPTLLITRRTRSVFSEATNRRVKLVTGGGDAIISALYSLKKQNLDTSFYVVGDISPEKAGSSIELRLLSLLEDFEPQAIFVSSTDSFSPVFLSRFKAVKKETNYVPNERNDKSVLSDVLQKDNGLFLLIKNCPTQLPFFLRYKRSNLPVKEKLLQLF